MVTPPSPSGNDMAPVAGKVYWLAAAYSPRLPNPLCRGPVAVLRISFRLQLRGSAGLRPASLLRRQKNECLSAGVSECVSEPFIVVFLFLTSALPHLFTSSTSLCQRNPRRSRPGMPVHQHLRSIRLPDMLFRNDRFDGPGGFDAFRLSAG